MSYSHKIEKLTVTEKSMSTEQVKTFLRVDYTDTDDEIDLIYSAAADFIGNLTNTLIDKGTYRLSTTVRGDKLLTMADPIDSVQSVTTRAHTFGSDTVTVQPTDYEIRPDILRFRNWQDARVTVELTGGYGLDARAELKQAVLLVCTHLYQNRSAVDTGVTALPYALKMGVQQLVTSIKR